jgi:HSP20 family protein
MHPVPSLTEKEVAAMALTPYRPMQSLSDLQSEMNRLFSAVPAESGETGLADWAPAVDVSEDEQRYVIKADVPGVDPSEIEITMEGDNLRIQGERKEERNVDTSDQGNRQRTERFYGRFLRTFTLPDTADAENIRARSNNGVLEITIPKQERAKPRQIQVEQG